MAPAPAPRKEKGFDWGHPGGKEALVGGGVALLLALAYFWWKNRQAQQAAPSGQGTNFIVSPTGQFMSWVHDHQGSTTTTVTVPNVVGQRAEVAGQVIKGVGLVPKLNVGTPKGRTGTITAENPAAGTKVATGSVVNLTNKISGGDKPPKKDGGGDDSGGDS